MICVIEAAKIRKRQNAIDVEDTWLNPLRCGFADFSPLWPAKIPVIDTGVERPQGGIFGPLSMLDCDSNLGRLSSFELRIE